MGKKTQVLIAEDDLQLGFIIKDNLEEEGFDVSHCPDGNSAWEEFLRVQPDICLLDVNMPCRDGFSLARKIRQKSDVVPILFLSAKSMQEDKLKGFQSGADDYITKPFDMEELLSRMQVFLRRNRLMQPKTSETYAIGHLQFIPGENRIQGGGKEILLTRKESQLLEFFCARTGQILKKEEILTNVWGKNDYFLGRSMDVFMNRLRKILAVEPLALIETLPQVGYRFVLRPS